MIVSLAIAGRETAGWQTAGWAIAGWATAGWEIAGWEIAGWAIPSPKKALKSLRPKPRMIAGLVTVGLVTAGLVTVGLMTVGWGIANNLPMVRPSGFTQNFVKPLARTADTGFHGLFADPQNHRRIGLCQAIDGTQDQRFLQLCRQAGNDARDRRKSLPISCHDIGADAIFGDFKRSDIQGRCKGEEPPYGAATAPVA